MAVEWSRAVFIRAGRAVRYRRRDLLAWIDQNTVLPGPPFVYCQTARAVMAESLVSRAKGRAP
jgi:hypothetical protein